MDQVEAVVSSLMDVQEEVQTVVVAVVGPSIQGEQVAQASQEQTVGGAYQLVAVAVEVESAICLEEVYQDANSALCQLQASAAAALMVVGEEPFSEDLWDQE